jgi:hypothetical protein
VLTNMGVATHSVAAEPRRLAGDAVSPMVLSREATDNGGGDINDAAN